MVKIYQVITILLIPIIVTNIFIRIIKKKEDKKRFVERLGKPTIEKSNDKNVRRVTSSSIPFYR